jgi:predicted nucleotidyltransferase component of viral defense system
MITTADLHRAAAAEGLRFDQAEKDYVILWVLYGLSHPDVSPKGWVFKGGTCLRHCYYPGYRFSEDLDFTCLPESGGLKSAQAVLGRAAVWVQENSGIRMATKSPLTIPGDFQVEIPLEYSRGGMRARGLPAIKVQLTSDEPILSEIAVRLVQPQYSDLSDFKIAAYSKMEIVAEKMRALLQQQKKWPRPRDLYDLWFMLCRSGERFHREELKKLYMKKCAVRDIDPDPAGLISEQLRELNQEVWVKLLGPMMKEIPDFDQVWNEWTRIQREIFR